MPRSRVGAMPHLPMSRALTETIADTDPLFLQFNFTKRKYSIDLLVWKRRYDTSNFYNFKNVSPG